MKNWITLPLLLLATANIAWASKKNTKVYKPSHCVHLASEKQILKCLTNFSMAQLEQGSSANQTFNTMMDSYAHRFDLDIDNMKVTPLKDYFRIVVDEKNHLKGKYLNQSCFEFAKDANTRRQQILNIQNQIIEVTDFLAQFHAMSLGRQVSLLFPIKEIRICGMDKNGDRPMAFRMRRLHVGIDSNSEKIYMADTLLNIWNTGDPIRVSNEKRFVPTKARHIYHGMVNQDIDLILRDKIAEKWHILNPISEKRTTAVSILLEIFNKAARVSSKLGTVNSLDPKEAAAIALTEMMETAQGPGFTEQMKNKLLKYQDNPEAILSLYRKWLSRINSVKSIASHLETGMVRKGSRTEIVIMARDTFSLGASYTNDHDIAGTISQMLSRGTSLDRFEEKDDSQAANLPQETLEYTDEGLFSTRKLRLELNQGSKIHTNFDETTGGLFAGSTADVIDVKLELPQIKFPVYKRATLYEVIEEGHDYSHLSPQA